MKYTIPFTLKLQFDIDLEIIFFMFITQSHGDLFNLIFRVFSVFEYIPDSEEASQSQPESIISSGSHPEKKDVSEDELEFLERTQAFIANMQKLRQEIRDEQVEEEEIEMTEHHEVRGILRF